MLVVHVQVGFRPGLPEVSGRNKLFAAIKSSSQHLKLFEGATGAINPALGPETDDIVVTKHRVSADCCADLDAELHGTLLKRLFPQRAAVVTAGEFVQALQST